jgi:hypothetical protein
MRRSMRRSMRSTPTARFLMKGDVFSNDRIAERSGIAAGGDPDGNAGGAGVLHRGINAWIAYKREHEADHVWLRSVPAELQLYDDC